MAVPASDGDGWGRDAVVIGAPSVTLTPAEAAVVLAALRRSVPPADQQAAVLALAARLLAVVDPSGPTLPAAASDDPARTRQATDGPAPLTGPHSPQEAP